MDKFDFFSVDNQNNSLIIKYKDKRKNLTFIIILAVLGFFLFFVAFQNDAAFFTIFFSLVALAAIGFAIFLLLIQLNWKLRITGKEIQISDKLGRWQTISDIKSIRNEAGYTTGKYGEAGQKFYHSKIVFILSDNEEKILLTSAGTFSPEIHSHRHLDFKQFCEFIGDKIDVEVQHVEDAVSLAGDNRKTLY